MNRDTMIILTARDVEAMVSGNERQIIDCVSSAYKAHFRGESSLPHSSFLRIPNDQANRIIALPAYLGAEFDVAGIKWVSSFPQNLEKEMDRASAVIILNSVTTGRPRAILEGSIISATRTAASAALAAQALHRDVNVDSVGVIGCGLINFEIQKFLLTVFKSIRRLYLYDLNPDRAAQFKRACEKAFKINAETVSELDMLFRASPLVSIATTAIHPYISDLSALAPHSTVLHISLRDLAPEVILACDNVVDDPDHVSRERTSIHLAEQMAGTREFIRSTIGAIVAEAAQPRPDAEGISVFSPFGLGILDIAVAEFVYKRAVEEGLGTRIESFLPSAWHQRASVGLPGS